MGTSLHFHAKLEDGITAVSREPYPPGPKASGLQDPFTCVCGCFYELGSFLWVS